MQYMKLSTSRDFRINAATLDAALQEQDNSQEVSVRLSGASLTLTVSLLLPFCLITSVDKAGSKSRQMFPRGGACG